MSHIELEAIFKRFKESFPPAKTYVKGETLQLTTSEIQAMITDFCPGINIPDLYSFMISEGYDFKPIEYNETVTFYWLLDKS